ncbi:fimbria/pilus outer membrane usher protein [Erwinia piriflorinigrans]|uniref:Outer membrane usher protein fimD n=1 Tax=Erwinia piriflorinigrans CFBP 5888 TaxID=1161919 RepID=V5Z4F4_9GAMM|nr:fimbria/pilus outer membrane usher protein [Erwinia piriflorinigrans]CCG85843.1 Outer membrane usher protein fimD precursor [Erwinia piriflorinigrans CFBP 5888]
MQRCRAASLYSRTLAMTGLLSSLVSSGISAETFNGLPPPPPAASSTREKQTWTLALIINGRDTGELIPVQFHDNHYLIRASDLLRVGIPSSRITSTIMDVSAMEQVKADYDSQGQRIVLTVPPGWLPEQTISGAARNGDFYAGRSSNGALFNYDFYTSNTRGSGSHLSAWNELRLFGSKGQFSSNGIWQQQLSGASAAQNDGYTRYDTWWTSENEENAQTLRVGDLVTDSLAWSNSVRLGGVQFGRDFSVRPDLITYPLPSFAGQAAVPSTVDLFINGYKNSSNSVQSGPFSLTNMPFVNGAGEAVVVTTDALGRRVSTTLPFYVASALLKKGLSDYAISGGALRENYGLNSFDYGQAAGSGSYRYGVSDWLTLESHAEAAKSLALGGGGLQMGIGPFGVVNGAISQSQMQSQTGKQYNWGYQYSASRYSFGFQQTVRSAEFANLALYGERQISSTLTFASLSRRSAQYSASLALDRLGNLGAALIDITPGMGERTRLLNLSWSKTIFKNSNLYLSATRDQQEGSWSGALSLIVPFSDLSNVSMTMQRDAQGNNSQRIDVSRAMPSDGGLAYNAAWANQSINGDYRQATLQWRNNQLDASAGFYGDDSYSTRWAELSGSLILMDNNLFAANQVNDAFVLVKTDYPGIKVSYENQLMGETNSKGYLLVPRVSAWYPAKYEINTLNLPADMTSSSVEQRFAVRRQSGYLLHLPVTPLRAANVILQDQHGEPLPVSTIITREGQQDEYVGYDGIVWMENLAIRNVIRAETPDGRHCNTELTVAETKPKSLMTYGPVVCALSSLPTGTAR